MLCCRPHTHPVYKDNHQLCCRHFKAKKPGVFHHSLSRKNSQLIWYNLITLNQFHFLKPEKQMSHIGHLYRKKATKHVTKIILESQFPSPDFHHQKKRGGEESVLTQRQTCRQWRAESIKRSLQFSGKKAHLSVFRRLLVPPSASPIKKALEPQAETLQSLESYRGQSCPWRAKYLNQQKASSWIQSFLSSNYH